MDAAFRVYARLCSNDFWQFKVFDIFAGEQNSACVPWKSRVHGALSIHGALNLRIFPLNKLGLATSFISISLATSSVSFAQQGAVRKACEADYQTLCSGVQPGGGRIISCLEQNSAKLSSGCAQALTAAKAAR